jgi:hypothetical protein
MADTARTRAAILVLFADNVTGQINEQDLRDFVVTVMPAEFAYANDFWVEPLAAQLTAEGTRGWHLYSQAVDSAVSFGYQLYKTVSGTWKTANCADSDMNFELAIAASDIASGDSGILLRRGLIYKSAYSGIFSGYVGRPVYLESGVIGSIAGPASIPTSAKIIGMIEDDTSGMYRFDPAWSVVGA